MVTDKEVKLVDQLLDKTRKRSITWEPTAKNDEFLSALGGRVSFTSLGYAEARRVALKVDESLNDVLDQLGRMDA